MPAAKSAKFRFGIVGSDTLRGKEIKSVLSVKKAPVKTLEFYDPDVVEEYGKLTQFRDEPMVVHHLDPKSLEGLDLVFLASDVATDTTYGELAAELGYRAVDLSEAFNARADVPLIVAGVNDGAAKKPKALLVANPNPVTIMLSHLFHALGSAFGVAKAVSFVLEPVSAYEEEGIQELADQSFALLGGSSVSKKLFREQIAFNVLPRTGKPDSNGFSTRERQVLAEIGRVLGPRAAFPLTLSIVLAPVFHTYSIMTYLELAKDASIAALEQALQCDTYFKVGPAEGAGSVSSVSVAGKDKIFVGSVKREETIPRGFWVWAVADNLTLGSAANAYDVARLLLGIT